MVRRALPVRTCVGCRERAPASMLLRVVADVDAVVPVLKPDPRRRLPGRGAHLHVDPDCFAKAERRRAFTRALRVTGVLDTGPLTAYLATHANVADRAAGTPDGGSTHRTSKDDRHEHAMNPLNR